MRVFVESIATGITFPRYIHHNNLMIKKNNLIFVKIYDILLISFRSFIVMEVNMNNIQKAYSVLLAYAVNQTNPTLLCENVSFDDKKSLNDFTLTHQLSSDDLKKLSILMKKAISRGIKVNQSHINSSDFNDLVMKGKVSPNIDVTQFPADNIPLVSIGDFCMVADDIGISNTNELVPDAFRLMSISAVNAGREVKNNAQRISLISANTKQELETELERLNEAQKRDHRKIGQEMELFFISENGPGLAMFQPNGAIIRRTIENFEHFEHAKRGYKPVYTPHVYDASVWKRSGHYDCYKENMFLFEEDGKEMGVKPMNCPGHVEIFKRVPRSYRDLPIKFFELGTVYRREDRGALQGLLRVTNITQDDAHIFCRKDQLKGELVNVIDFVEFMMKTFGLKTEYVISTRPEDKFLGTKETWDYSEKSLKDALTAAGIKSFGYDIGGGAFYGPKIDVKMQDALGRKWQGPTIQLDFNFPERFGLEYTNAEGKKERPVMLHRTVLGSMERFLGVLIEHYNGKFPLWLAPEQCAVIAVNEKDPKVQQYKDQIVSSLQEEFRMVDLSSKSDSLGSKIAKARNRRIPYTIVVGGKEAENQTVSVRVRDDNSQHSMPLQQLISILNGERKQKALVSPFVKSTERGENVASHKTVIPDTNISRRGRE